MFFISTKVAFYKEIISLKLEWQMILLQKIKESFGINGSIVKIKGNDGKDISTCIHLLS